MHSSRFQWLFQPLVLLVLLVAGCRPAADNQLTAGVLLPREDLALSLVRAGFEDAATKAAIRVLVDGADGQLDREMRLINKMISLGVRALIITPVSPTGSYEALARAKEADIPIVCFRTCVEPAGIASAYVTVDDRELGSTSGDAVLKFIVSRLGGEARIGMLTCGQDERCRQRKAGFMARVRMLQAEIAAETQLSSPESARSMSEAMLNADPEINLVWAADRVGTAAAVSAVKGLGRAGQVFVFGTGIDDETIAALQAEDDILQGVADHLPYQMGFIALDAALSAIAGGEMSSPIAVPPIYLGRENSALIREFQQRQGRLVPTPAPVATSAPGDTSGACSTCNPKAHPVIPTP